MLSVSISVIRFDQVVNIHSVVLGGDHPLAMPLIEDLEHKGYIVIVSVSTIQAVEIVENKCNGYVRALILDPDEVSKFSIQKRFCIWLIYFNLARHYTFLPSFPYVDFVA